MEKCLPFQEKGRILTFLSVFSKTYFRLCKYFLRLPLSFQSCLTLPTVNTNKPDLSPLFWRRSKFSKLTEQLTQHSPERILLLQCTQPPSCVTTQMEVFFFTIRAMKHWNRMPSEGVDAPSSGRVKVRLDVALSNLT